MIVQGRGLGCCLTGAQTDYSCVGLSQNLSTQEPDETNSTDVSMKALARRSREPGPELVLFGGRRGLGE